MLIFIGSFEFEKIEIDCLIHFADNLTETILLSPPIYHVLPSKTWSLAHPTKSTSAFRGFHKKISEEAIDDNADVYGVFEITIDKNMYPAKLAQLERDLTVLLHRKKVLDSNVEIQDLVRFAGIATTKALIQHIRIFIETYYDMLPLLSTLYSMNRVVVVKVDRDLKYVARKIAQLNSYSDVFSSISNQKPVVHSVKFVGIKNGEYCDRSDYIIYPETISCDSLMTSAGIQIIPKPGHRVQLKKLDESGEVGDEIPIDVPLYSVAGSERLILLISVIPIISIGSDHSRTISDMNQFFEVLKSIDGWEEEDSLIVEKVFKEQRIKFSQLSTLTDAKLEKYGLIQGGLREAVLSVIRENNVQII
jgi:hypothetical protein